jgi:uncharacterized protein (TIGR03067 family)
MVRAPLLIGLLLTAAPASDVVSQELTGLQGVWIQWENPPNSAKGVRSFVFVKDRIISRHVRFDKNEKPQMTEEELAQFTLDPSASPKALDMTMLSGPHKGKMLRVAYFMKDGGLTLVLPTDPDAPRPTTIKDGLALHLLRAEKVAKMLERMGAARLPPPEDPFPPSQPDPQTLYLDIAADGSLVAGDNERLEKQSEWEAYIREHAPPAGKTAGRRSTVMIRCHRQAEFGRLAAVARFCREASIPVVKVRHQLKGPPPRTVELEYLPPDWRRPELASDILASARATYDGELSTVIVKDDGDPLARSSLSDLTTLLKEKRANAHLPDCLALAIESGLSHAAAAEVIEACLAAGFRHVVFVASEEWPVASRGDGSPLDPESAARINEEIRAIYRTDLPTAPPDRAKLAHQLRGSARACDDAPVRRALLEQTAELAQGSDAPLLLKVCAELGQDSNYGDWSRLLALLAKAPPSRELVACAWKLAGAATVRDDPQAAAQFLEVAEQSARAINDRDLLNQVRERRQELQGPSSFTPKRPTVRSAARSIKPPTAAPSQDAFPDILILAAFVLFALALLAGAAFWILHRKPARVTHPPGSVP